MEENDHLVLRLHDVPIGENLTGLLKQQAGAVVEIALVVLTVDESHRWKHLLLELDQSLCNWLRRADGSRRERKKTAAQR